MKSYNLLLHLNTIFLTAFGTTSSKFIDKMDLRASLNPTNNNYREDMYLSFPQLVEKYGYSVQNHKVKTSDGYLLTMYRIPKKGPAVLLVLGAFLSSDDFVTIGPQAGLPYQLADAGFDVWLGNCRGTKYSLRHVKLPTNSAAYWDFTFDEIGRYDMPALIDHILDTTKAKDLKILGYSISTNAISVLCSEKPEYNYKISLIYLLSPVIFTAHIKSTIFKILAGPLTPDLYLLAKSFGVHSILSGEIIWRNVELLKKILCNTPETAYDICHSLLFLVFGPDHHQVNTTSLPVIYGHFPTSTSVKCLQHAVQLIASGKFRQYDYGTVTNLIKYSSADPPEYSLKNITTKVAIAWANNDWMCAEEDLQILLDKLPNVIDVYKVPNEEFSHTDYIFARDVKTLLYDKVTEILKLN